MKEINSLIQKIQEELAKVKAFSWQTFVFLSWFSWLVAFAVANPLLEDVIARVGWIFFTMGLAWATKDFKIEVLGLTLHPGPWLTGALVCGFVLAGLPGGIPFYVTLWPLVSAVIALTPSFLKNGSDLFNPLAKEPKKLAGDRQEMLSVLLFAILLSCWIQFHFLVQDWLVEYPSLRVDDLGRSAFLVKFGSKDAAPSKGYRMLDSMQPILQEQFARMSWSEVEQWLLNLSANLPALRDQAIAALPADGDSENNLWNLQAQVLPGEPEYTLRFRAFWRGPSANPQGYFVERVCRISRTPIAAVGTPGSATFPATNPATNPAGNAGNRVECQPVADRIWVQ
ncbi:MAG TPA: DUF5357 family protein [Chroococcidiopsis sp.]